MAAMLTHGITPVVCEHGSLGCSGDLAPLAHCALAMMGEGTVRDATRPPAAETDTRQRLDQVVNAAWEAMSSATSRGGDRDPDRNPRHEGNRSTPSISIVLQRRSRSWVVGEYGGSGP